MARIVIGTTGTLISTSNATRQSILITNISGTDVFLDGTSGVTPGTGILLVNSGGAIAEDAGGRQVYQGPYYGIATTAAVVSVWERERTN